jgi:hypothetical protein
VIWCCLCMFGCWRCLWSIYVACVCQFTIQAYRQSPILLRDTHTKAPPVLSTDCGNSELVQSLIIPASLVATSHFTAPRKTPETLLMGGRVEQMQRIAGPRHGQFATAPVRPMSASRDPLQVARHTKAVKREVELTQKDSQERSRHLAQDAHQTWHRGDRQQGQHAKRQAAACALSGAPRVPFLRRASVVCDSCLEAPP